MEQGQYNYSPLESGGREIRLVILESAEDIASNIKIHLIHVSLGTLLSVISTPAGNFFSYSEEDPLPHYSALSYCWGDAIITRTILLDDIQTAVTSNLESALRHLRLPDRDRRLWIDALCINQDNIVEKSEQILLMRDIYASAHEVIVWLGDAGPNSGLAMNFISKHVVFHGGVINDSDLLESMKEKEAALAFHTIGGDLLKRPWWFRAWVWQEIACAKRAIVQCGPFDVQWDKLAGALAFADRNGVTTSQLTYAELEQGAFYAPYKEMQIYRRKRFLEHPIKLLEILCSSWRCGATDPRDKVFALLGLTTDSPSPLLSPDYSKSLTQVYRDVVRFTVETNNRLDIMCASTHSRPHSELPSWVPDWSDSSQCSNILAPICLDDKSYGRYYFNASRDSTADAEFLNDGNHLSVSGCGDDTVECVGQILINQLEIIDVLCSWRDMLHIEDERTRQLPYIAGSTKRHAFNRTVCVDRDFYGFRAQAGARGLDFDPKLIPDNFLPHLPETTRRKKAFIQQLGAVEHNAPRRRFFITRKGYMGLGPPKMQEGDVVTILKGCSVPVLLREYEAGIYHRFVGEAYVCGIMDGEMMEEFENGNSSWRRFVLQ